MQTTLDVNGMTCSHCETAVKNALEALDGVNAVEVHLDTGKVDVTSDDGGASIADMRKAVEDQGYDVVV